MKGQSLYSSTVNKIYDSKFMVLERKLLDNQSIAIKWHVALDAIIFRCAFLPFTRCPARQDRQSNSVFLFIPGSHRVFSVKVKQKQEMSYFKSKIHNVLNYWNSFGTRFSRQLLLLSKMYFTFQVVKKLFLYFSLWNL